MDYLIGYYQIQINNLNGNDLARQKKMGNISPDYCLFQIQTQEQGPKYAFLALKMKIGKTCNNPVIHRFAILESPS